jgi:hypothetical protein
MALVDQLFTEIIANPPVINSGAGGWDTVLTQFMADRRGRHGFGLLARLIDMTSIPSSNLGSILITAPAGWLVMPTQVLFFAAADPVYPLTFQVGGGGTEKEWAHPTTFPVSHVADQPYLVFPSPEGADIFTSSLNNYQVPHVDGDNAAKNTFRVRRQSATADTTYSFYVFGHAWPASD